MEVIYANSYVPGKKERKREKEVRAAYLKYREARQKIIDKMGWTMESSQALDNLVHAYNLQINEIFAKYRDENPEVALGK